LYNLWIKDKKLIDQSWNEYFQKIENVSNGSIEYSNKGLPNVSSTIKTSPPLLDIEHDIKNNSTDKISLEDTNKVNMLIRAYQRNGYIKADIDPLGIDFLKNSNSHYAIYESINNLNYKTYGFNEEDLERKFYIYTDTISGIFSEKSPIKLKEIIDRLEKAYCRTIGPDYMHISSKEECNFIREKFEVEWANYKSSHSEETIVFDRLAWAVLFEEFLHNKFSTHTRFGLEGLECLITGLKWFVDSCVGHGVKEITIGMAHRGRLNVLANVMKKSLSLIFGEFQGKILVFDESGQMKENGEIEYIQSGDVKYHLGTFNEKVYKNGKSISMDLLANPAHLEAVNPVVIGKVRAKQHFNKDESRNEYIALLIHGDAAFNGQGVVYETMQMENLKNYSIGGTVHVISNNQIGFTTSVEDGRSTPFACDILKSYECPIIHVNAEDPIALDFAFKVAADYRIKFNKDIAIDIIGYRRYGHSEIDQPMFTQPHMYRIIQKKKNILKIYQERLIKEGKISEEECKKTISKIKNLIDANYKDAENNVFEKSEWISKQWQHLAFRKYSAPKNTGVNIKTLREINELINILPSNYNFHPTVKKIYESRFNSVASGKNIDMATAEALCWASLLEEGYTVRISGEDAQRGAFSHRHSVLYDQENDKNYIPLKKVPPNPNNFQSCNSQLSEFAVLGFELGFSYYNPDSLIIWEAQYGDFANGAQIIIDQFIASGERKWNAQTGIVLNLPHGMDGEGPEHSSARLERFLQMMDDDINHIYNLDEKDRVTQIQESNYQVCYPTTSANYFHLLRRQVKRDFRKPLIIAQSKRLLRYKMAYSTIDEFDENKRFIKVRQEFQKNIIDNRNIVKLIIACSGQIYYDLIIRREKLKINDVAIIAVEQLGPFPYIEFIEAIDKFPNASIRWVQEEHFNQGAWEYVHSRINNLLKITNRGGQIDYAGRSASSAAAAAYHTIFEKEHLKLMEDAFK
jgi:2-oxoglutarate dehydrogenase E1 component